MNRHGHFDAFARALHWSMAILILAMLFVGVGMVASLSLRPVLIDLHRPLGMALLALAVIRLLHRWRSPPPPLPASHVALYAAMLAMPLLGWAMLSAGGYPVRMTSTFSLPPLLPQDPALYSLLRLAHGWVGYALFALILLHAAAALHHAWVRRDGVFEAMARGRSGTTTTAEPDPGTPPES